MEWTRTGARRGKNVVEGGRKVYSTCNFQMSFGAPNYEFNNPYTP